MAQPLPMTSLANRAKDRALAFLIKETFNHVHNYKDEQYRKLAHANCMLRNIHPVEFFMHDGMIYPGKTSNGTKINGIRVTAPPLHASLLDDFDQINDLLDDQTETELKNLFAKILEISTNRLVLEKLLPTILYNDLKSYLSEEDFQLVDEGWAASKLQTQTDVSVLGQMKMLEVNYADAFTKLRRVLMERLLLDGV